ncbi:MAG: VacB/RNase II family 3'-5' exoribonuclease [Oceanicoccus sp.]
MLDNSTLSQLKQLKQDIEDSKEYAEGLVKGTQRKFGFVVLEDGREIFLSPDEMIKVFPGDTVKILITTEQQNTKDKNAKPKVSGALQALLHSPLKEFSGRYIVKGQGHFVEPDFPQLHRWIFIPPAARKNASAGDYIRCKISRHPYPNEKPQAKILEVIGNLGKKGIEAEYVTSKFQLDPAWKDNWEESLADVDFSQRKNMQDVPFVTIDAASTRDMDDALYASKTDQGWRLQVAIADPDAFIISNSDLDKQIANRAISTYMPGCAIPMLPAKLANDLCSLAPEQIRPAIVCTIDVNSSGDIEDYTISEATICSQAKLSYDHVSAFLEQRDDATALANCSAHSEALIQLKQLSDALFLNRKEKNLVIPNRPDLRLVLNAKGKMDRIELQHKNSASQVVEECMIAANRCVTQTLDDDAIFVSHPGFRPERVADVCKLAEEQLSLTNVDVTQPDGYQRIIKSIDDDSLDFPLRAVLSRLLSRARLSNKRLPHFGMGLPSYTTFTSPIRKYTDLLVHRIIKEQLRGLSQTRCSDEQLAAIQQRQDNSRQARSQMEQWLKCQFIQPLIGQEFSGQISQINSNGFTVRLDENLIEGFVETRTLPDKYSFDPMRLRLKSKNLTIELDQTIKIVVKEVDCDQRSIRFTLPLAAQQTTVVSESESLPIDKADSSTNKSVE